jgi:uncharacterized protein with HEPN domain
LTGPRDYRDFLNDLVDACQSIIKFVEGMTFEIYLEDKKTRYAVTRAYEILGEAVRHVPEDVKTANPQTPWSTIVAVRNRVIHGYFGINDQTLFAAVENDLKALLPELEALARKHGARN